MTEATAAKTPYQIAKEEAHESLVKSNMANLASAHVRLEEDIIRYQEKITEAKNLQTEIDQMGESGEKNVDKIRELYHRATGGGYRGITGSQGHRGP